jgi:MFS family permease
MVWERLLIHNVGWLRVDQKSIDHYRCAFQPMTGRIFQFFSLKWAYMAFLFVFEVGSLICALSPSSVVLIIGRAVAGIGASGLFPGALIIIANISPPSERPSKY